VFGFFLVDLGDDSVEYSIFNGDCDIHARSRQSYRVTLFYLRLFQVTIMTNEVVHPSIS